jgi:hypothetical protein
MPLSLLVSQEVPVPLDTAKYTWTVFAAACHFLNSENDTLELPGGDILGRESSLWLYTREPFSDCFGTRGEATVQSLEKNAGYRY